MEVIAVKVGQIWKDNYIAAGGATRFVKVLKVPAKQDGDVTIQRCTEAGEAMAHSPQRTTASKRFNGKKDGFSLHQDVAADAPLAPAAGAADQASA